MGIEKGQERLSSSSASMGTSYSSKNIRLVNVGTTAPSRLGVLTGPLSGPLPLSPFFGLGLHGRWTLP